MDVIAPLLRFDAYATLRQSDRLSVEVTPAEFAALAKHNHWQPVTVGLLLKPPVVMKVVRMGRLSLSIIEIKDTASN